MKSVSVSPASANITVGATEQFVATAQYSDGSTANVSSTATWAVAISSVAAVNSSGLVTAKASGSTNVTASLNGATGTAAITVPPLTVTSIAVSPTTANISVGAAIQFTATTQPPSNTPVSWLVDGVSGGNPTVGTISTAGLYTAPARVGSHTLTATIATDASVSATAAVSVFSFTVSPAASLVVPGGAQQFNSTIQGFPTTSVTWSVDGMAGGNSTSGTITTNGLYTAPFATGAHVITATSVADPAASITGTVTVINSSPGAVLTYHNDDTRQGAFTQETSLMPSTVSSSQFGKLLSYPVDGQVYAQPLYLPQLTIAGVKHNVVFVATENDTVYAFDADGSQTTPLWTKSLGIPVPNNDAEGVSPELGVTSTPVLDVTTGTLYVVSESTDGPFKLHALDVASGAEKFGGPILITGSVAGTGWDSSGGTISLESSCYQRMGLALNPVNDAIYIAFGHCSHGWVLAYDKTTLRQTAIFNSTPDGAGGALWGGGGAPAIDDLTGDLYLITGVDAGDPGSGYNDSFLHLAAKDMSVLDFFMPDNESFLRANDADLGSGAAILMPDNTSSTPHEVIGGGKDGRIFVVNGDSMGSFSPTTNNVIETVQTGVKQFDNIFSTPAYWNGFVYLHCEDDVLHAFSWNNGLLTNPPTSSSATTFRAHGATASVSANGAANGILWEIDNSNYTSKGPAVLHAYDATNVSNELYNSSQAGSRDTAGIALKFTVPTIAGGRVFVGTSTELDIYGLLGH